MKLITSTKQESALPACVATVGFFDGVHLGHQFLIGQVRQIARERSLHSAVITFPVHPRKVMQPTYSPQLLSTVDEKVRHIEQTGVDECFLLPFTPQLSMLSAREFMQSVLKEQFGVQVLVIGYDHRFGHNRSEGFEDYVRYGKELGIDVVQAEACQVAEIAVSSSVCRAFLEKGDVAMAARCLGYNYTLGGTVIDGFKVGRKLGFPTANIQPDCVEKLLPAHGVYAVRVRVNEHYYKGMLNIGSRPTLESGGQVSIEVHILHFEENIYQENIQIEFIAKLRDEQKFASLDDLINQLSRDAAAVENLIF